MVIRVTGGDSMRCPKCQLENAPDSKFCRECGTPLLQGEGIRFSQTVTLQTPFKVLDKGVLFAGKYKITGEIGRGGMGVVLKAEDTKLKRTVALKLLPPELGLDPEAKERFIREAQAAAALDHPHICTIYEAEESGGQAYIALAYVEGQSLKNRIAQGPLEVKEALEIAAQVAEGLEEAHRKGIIHRDIKSANIMVNKKGQAKIMDFGLAKVRGESQITQEARTMGTAAYMSPEQARGEDVDHRTDIWSLAVVIYEMLSGALPFKGEGEASILYSIVHKNPLPLRALKPDIPLEFQRVVDRCLKKKPEARYGSVSDLLSALTKCQEGLAAGDAGALGLRPILRLVRKPVVAVPAGLILAACAFALVGFLNRQAKVRWARNVAVPEIGRLVDKQDFAAAFRLAERAGKIIPDEPRLRELSRQVERDLSFRTVPPGADVYLGDVTDGTWRRVARTPTDKLRVWPGYHLFRIEKDGYEPVEGGAPTVADSVAETERTLDEKGSLPPGMVRVPGGKHELGLAGLDHLGEREIGDYLIDKHEVTNGEFKKFVDQGGYVQKKYWRQPFQKDGKALSFEQAMAEFKDRTGRPGPATWEMSDFPEGQEDYPVDGISWYEAEAYAEFAGKELPTIYHWDRAAGTPLSDYIIPLSHFGGRGPSAAGGSRGMSPYGVQDMAGNVREWCWNMRGDWRFLLGGAWNDPVYMFNYAFAQPPWDRAPGNGFRCMKSLGTEDHRDALVAKIEDPYIDFMAKKPVSDEVYNIYLNMYAYDRKELRSRTESVDQSNKDWTKEKVSFDAAYGGERVPAYLFLPKSGKPPYQAVVYFPGSSPINIPSSEKNEFLGLSDFDFIVKSGRAFLFPIYKSTYERRDGLDSSIPDETNSYREHVLQWAKDLERSLDYLESRSDIDSDKLAYYGYSWGGRLGGIMIAVGGRFKAAILNVAGFRFQKQKPEVDPFHFISRVRIPVLMLNGRYDSIFPYETAQLPMFKLLGTPGEHKRQILYDTGHSIPRDQVIKESLAWLDKYLGRVKR
jgi:formylglycine-generating enzyme required for sulfatase activity/dienelactone hydrolase/predicted Ser/Thr protein kinase